MMICFCCCGNMEYDKSLNEWNCFDCGYKESNNEDTLYKDALKSLSVFFCDIRVYHNNGFKFKVRFL